MEVQTKNIFYIAIWEKEDFYSGKLLRPLLYPGGKIQVYFCVLPDEKELSKNRWKRKRREKFLLHCLSEAYQEACEVLRDDGFESFDTVLMSQPFIQFFSHVEKKIKDERIWELWRHGQDEIPEELFSVCLQNARAKNNGAVMNISLPKDCSETVTEQMITLLTPYLSRVNLMVYVGEPSWAAEAVEEYLYEEYGIVTIFGKYPREKCIWIDLSQGECFFLNKYTKESEIYPINYAEVLKFLDTAIKNGYNNKVN